ncbi:MAG TPA: hydrogenase maturation nickel metallochaperone HypA [Syntrophales bacterium]|nr:hydrogenase maturation nickel metallochaperone HypA [Syntrophales bacterium]
MHELSLVHSLIDIVEDYSQRERFTRVRSLKLSFGRLSCIDPDAFRFVFSVQAEGTKAEGARLEFDIRPAALYCLTCEREFSSAAFHPACPGCGGSDVFLTGGTEEMKLLEMDVD